MKTSKSKEQVKIKNGILFVGDSAEVGVNERALQEFFIDQFITASDIVLEIGYGLGFAAKAIDSKLPKKHTIIEVNDVLCRQARSNFPQARVIGDMWQNVDLNVFREANKVVYRPVVN